MNGRGVDHLIGDRVEHLVPAQGLMNGHVWPIIQDEGGAIRAGTWAGFFELEQGRFVNQSDGTRIGGAVLANCEDHENGIWLATVTVFQQQRPRFIRRQPEFHLLAGNAKRLIVPTRTETAPGILPT